MLETRDVWQDGQAGVSWFAGVHIAGWVVSGQVLNKPGEKRWRERMSLNATWLLHRATVRRPAPDRPADPAASPAGPCCLLSTDRSAGPRKALCRLLREWLCSGTLRSFCGLESWRRWTSLSRS